MDSWLKFGLTPYGRVHLIKSVALSQLVYTMTVIEKPNKQQLKEIEKIIFNFIWNKGKDKIKRTTMKNDYHFGGLKVPDPSVQADSLRIAWVKKYLDGDTRGKWKDVMKSKLSVTDTLTVFECNIAKKELCNVVRNPFRIETVSAWQTLSRGTRLTELSILNEPLWLNQALQLDNHPIIPKRRMLSNDVLRMKDLFNVNARRIMNCNELQRKYNCGCFLTWYTVLDRIPRDWKRILNTPDQTTNHRESDLYEELNDTYKTAKWSYRQLINVTVTTTPNKAQEKWERELQIQIGSWRQVFKCIYESTNEFKIRWLQLRLLHRILPTNRFLFLCRIRDDEKCDRCSWPVENILHIFWSCESSKIFWLEFKRIFSLATPLAPSVIILGTCERNGPLAAAPLRVALLLAKAYIWQCRNSGKRPDAPGFTKFIVDYLNVERYIAECTNGVDVFRRKYSQMLTMLGGVGARTDNQRHMLPREGVG